MSLVAMLAAPLSCKKKVPDAGGSCDKEGHVICKDDKNAMFCAGGSWQDIECRSINGCMSMGAAAKDSCTNAKHKEGEPCIADKPTCKFDGKGVMECQDNKWAVVQKCAGMNGCVVNAKGWKCDMSTGDAGDLCMESSKDSFACTPDKKKLLRCDGKTMVEHATCPGRHGCRKSFNKIECDGQKKL